MRVAADGGNLMLTIGLTGGIGVGKSAVAGILKGLGADTVNADGIGHEVYRAGTRAYREIVRTFGERVAGADGEIDRKRLGSIVFGDRAKLEALNGIVWPGIRQILQQRIHDIDSRGATAALVVEAAVLFEAGWDEDSFHYAVMICGLFNFYNRLIDGYGVKNTADFRLSRGRALAEQGYGIVTDALKR